MCQAVVGKARTIGGESKGFLCGYGCGNLEWSFPRLFPISQGWSLVHLACLSKKFWCSGHSLMPVRSQIWCIDGKGDSSVTPETRLMSQRGQFIGRQRGRHRGVSSYHVGQLHLGRWKCTRSIMHSVIKIRLAPGWVQASDGKITDERLNWRGRRSRIQPRACFIFNSISYEDTWGGHQPGGDRNGNVWWDWIICYIKQDASFDGGGAKYIHRAVMDTQLSMSFHLLGSLLD